MGKGTTRFFTTLPDDLAKKVDYYSNLLHISKTAVVTMLLMSGFARLKASPEGEREFLRSLVRDVDAEEIKATNNP